MSQFLVNSEKEYLKLFREFDVEDLEHFLDVEFAYVDGTFWSDIHRGKIINEDQEINYDLYRKEKSSLFPEKYPCIVVFVNENDMFIWGPKINFRFLEFVYLTDFNQ